MGASILSDTITPALARIKVLTGRSYDRIMKPVMRNAAASLAFQTQPYGIGEDAQKKGINAIRGDLLGKSNGSGGIVTIWKDYMPTSPGTGGTTKLFVTKDGHAYGVENNLFDLEGKQLAAHHKKYRSSSTGRVTKAGSFTRDVGRWKFVDKLVVKQEAFEKYMKKIGKMVGFAKGGWAVCARALGGTRGIPVWISHQKSAGRVIDRTDNTTDPSVTMINDVRYVSRCLSENQVHRALEIAVEKMIRNAEYIHAHNGRQAGFTVSLSS